MFGSKIADKKKKKKKEANELLLYKAFQQVLRRKIDILRGLPQPHCGSGVRSFLPPVTLSDVMLKIGKILHYLHHQIFRVCLAIFQQYA